MNFVSIRGETRTCFGSSLQELQEEAKTRGVSKSVDLNSKRALCDILEEKKLVQKSQFLVVCGESEFRVFDTRSKLPTGSEGLLERREGVALEYPRNSKFFSRACPSSVSISLLSSHAGKGFDEGGAVLQLRKSHTGKRLDEGGVVLQVRKSHTENTYLFAWVTAEHGDFQIHCEEIVLPE